MAQPSDPTTYTTCAPSAPRGERRPRGSEPRPASDPSQLRDATTDAGREEKGGPGRHPGEAICATVGSDRVLRVDPTPAQGPSGDTAPSLPSPVMSREYTKMITRRRGAGGPGSSKPLTTGSHLLSGGVFVTESQAIASSASAARNRRLLRCHLDSTCAEDAE